MGTEREKGDTGRRMDNRLGASHKLTAKKRGSNDLHNVICWLPAQCRTVLSLYYLEGFGLVEVARILRIPKGTVKSRLYTVSAEFKKLWQLHCEK